MQRGFHEPGEKPKRFYKAVTVAEVEAGFEVLLDGRNPRAPRGSRLALPTRSLADLVAAEWSVQGEHIEMAGMNATRLAHTAIEAIPAARAETAAQFAQYGGSDLLCYFADSPVALVARQHAAWDPILARAKSDLGLVLTPVMGIVHQPQPQASLDRIRGLAAEGDDFSLAGLAYGAALLGSAVLTLVLQRGWMGGVEALAISRVDELHQESLWGVDEEAAARTAAMTLEAAMLGHWFDALRPA